jgi:hypothetical protein
VTLDEHGFALLPAAVAPASLKQLAARVPEWERLPDARQRYGATFAVRGLLHGDPALPTLLEQCGLGDLVRSVAGQGARAVDALLFDKIPQSNWKVPGHQDVVMPVAELSDEPGFSGWTVRRGISYVQPPVSVLEGLVAARLHFDDSSMDNGPLAIVPGSHRLGRLPDQRLADFTASDYRSCTANAGDVLLMKPLLVHRSAPSTTPLHRRVLHVVYASGEPGERVRWRR